mgnify:CR=1 FL=1
MKQKLIFTLALLFLGITSYAQTNVKIGYTNVEYIVTQLPEYSSIEKQLEEFSVQLQKQLQSKIQEYRTKAQDLQQNYENMLPQVAKDKEEELGNLEQSINKFRQEADQSIQRKQMELLEPIYGKIESAIREVALANNYSHIFSDGMGAINILLYASEEDDVTNLVLKNLGVTPKEAAANSGN